MRLQRPSTHLVVAPSQVWDGLAAEAQAAAIQLLARLASDLAAIQPLPSPRSPTDGDAPRLPEDPI